MFSGIDRLLFILENTGKKYNIEKITKAYEYAKQLHEGQYRKSGEEYICHPVAVAEIVAGLELDTDSICAALLHDTLEDCADKIDIEKIKKEFGPQVAELVDGLTKLVQIRIEDKEDAHMESLRKMFLAMAKDVRVIFIKLADRLHNMRTLDAQPENKRRTIALETMHVYAPLAHRLGMQRIKQELENLALSYLDPIGYEEVSADIERKFGENRDFINKTRKLIHEKINENGIKCTLEGRVKSVYSIYKKMYNQNKSFDEIYDFYAIRIIVNTELECYTALGIIHEMFNSMPGRFKDYISIPKPNMYRSLHTTVIGRDGIPFEVQIRTWEMHQIAEYGIAAHWKYKSGDKGDGDLDRKLEWIAKLIENESSTADPDEFIDALKIDIFQDETFVFTPKGDVITLPQNANCIDFAYHIHSAVGNRMIGAKVNGMIVPIDRKLNNGEIVEIITSSASKGPSRDWLKVACTSEARAKIRQWFKKEKRAENIEAGKNEIQTELRRISPVHVTDKQFNEITGKVASRLGMNSPEDLFGMLGYGGISMTTVGSRLKEEFERVVMPEPEVKITDVTQVQTVQRPRSSHSYGGVIVDGVEGCQVKFAKCCNPLPGDNIVGFITKGYGISVHKVDCPNVLNSISKENDRFVNVEWKEVDETDSKNAQYEELIQVITEDRISMIADISTTLADMKVSIIQINTQKRAGGEIVFNIAVACKNLAHFNSIMARLKSIKDVVAVERGYAKNGG